MILPLPALARTRTPARVFTTHPADTHPTKTSPSGCLTGSSVAYRSVNAKWLLSPEAIP